MAEWESQAARDSMQAEIDHGDSDRAKRWRAMPNNEDFGEIVSFAGEETDSVIPAKES